jgi:hypothetical protein
LFSLKLGTKKLNLWLVDITDMLVQVAALLATVGARHGGDLSVAVPVLERTLLPDLGQAVALRLAADQAVHAAAAAAKE